MATMEKGAMWSVKHTDEIGTSPACAHWLMANIQWLNLIPLMFEDGLCKLSSSLNAGLCLAEGYELCLLSLLKPLQDNV